MQFSRTFSLNKLGLSKQCLCIYLIPHKQAVSTINHSQWVLKCKYSQLHWIKEREQFWSSNGQKRLNNLKNPVTATGQLFYTINVNLKMLEILSKNSLTMLFVIGKFSWNDQHTQLAKIFPVVFELNLGICYQLLAV